MMINRDKRIQQSAKLITTEKEVVHDQRGETAPLIFHPFALGSSQCSTFSSIASKRIGDCDCAEMTKDYRMTTIIPNLYLAIKKYG